MPRRLALVEEAAAIAIALVTKPLSDDMPLLPRGDMFLRSCRVTRLEERPCWANFVGSLFPLPYLPGGRPEPLWNFRKESFPRDTLR